MQRYWETVFDTLTGAAISGAEVWVWTNPGHGLANVYLDAAGTSPTLNPLTSDSNGFVECFIPDGLYDVEFKVAGVTMRTIENVAIFDLADMRADLNDIQTRMTAAEADIDALQAGLATEITDRAAAVTAETNARTTAVANEATARANADTALSNSIAALDADTYSKAEVDTALGLKLNSAAVSAYGLTLIDDADAATARGTLSVYSTAQVDAAIAAIYATAAQVRAGTVNNKAIAPDVLHSAAAPQALADAANIDWDMATALNAKVTLGGNRNFNAPTNGKVGITYALEAIQDGGGNRVPTWNAAFDWGSAGAPTLSTAAGKRDIIFLYCYDAATPKFRASFNKSA